MITVSIKGLFLLVCLQNGLFVMSLVAPFLGADIYMLWICSVVNFLTFWFIRRGSVADGLPSDSCLPRGLMLLSNMLWGGLAPVYIMFVLGAGWMKWWISILAVLVSVFSVTNTIAKIESSRKRPGCNGR